MTDLRKQIENLVADDRLEAALTVLREALSESEKELDQELIVHQAALAKVTREWRRGLVEASEEERVRNRIRYALLDLLREWKPPVAASSTVFISYSHADLGVAEKIRSALEAAGIRVCIDSKDIQAGEDIDAFIRRVVAASDVVLSIVSGTSLVSPWVGMESVHSLYDEALRGDRKLIACYLDDSFQEIEFRIAATDAIDARIGEIDALLPSYAERNIDTADLNRQKSRLFELRNNLGTILERLRNSLCLDIREPTWAESLPRLIAAIQGNQGV